MFNVNKCPHCSKAITDVSVEDVTLTVGFQPRWKGFSYSCPACHKVLGVEMNPLAGEVDLLNGVEKLLKKYLKK